MEANKMTDYQFELLKFYTNLLFKKNCKKGECDCKVKISNFIDIMLDPKMHNSLYYDLQMLNVLRKVQKNI